MQFSLVALLGLGALAVAAPAPASLAALPDGDTVLVARTGSKACCPKGKKYGCKPCPAAQPCPGGYDDSFEGCTTVGLINVVVCNVLNGNTLNAPVTLNLLS